MIQLFYKKSSMNFKMNITDNGMKCNKRDKQIYNQSIMHEKLFEFKVDSVISTSSWKAF